MLCVLQIIAIPFLEIDPSSSPPPLFVLAGSLSKFGTQGEGVSRLGVPPASYLIRAARCAR